MPLTDAQVGEYTECTHGENGGRLYGCIDCAIVWRTQQADKASKELARHEAWLYNLRAEKRRRAAEAAMRPTPEETK